MGPRLPSRRGIGFEVAAGEVFGFPGPNGAGKTTTIGSAVVAARAFKWEPQTAQG